MRRKAFLLTEQLMTILLQAGFILVLVTTFYLMLNFYTKTQQVLTARNRAERVIQFVDDNCGAFRQYGRNRYNSSR